MTQTEDRPQYEAILRIVSIPDAFLFFSGVEHYTGEFARSLTEFYDKLAKVPVEAVEFHFKRGDFEKWVGKTLGDSNLADSISRIDRALLGEELRTAMRDVVRKRLDELNPKE